MSLALKLLGSGLIAFIALLVWGIGAPVISRVGPGLGQTTGLGPAFVTNLLSTALFILLGAAGAFALFKVWSAMSETRD